MKDKTIEWIDRGRAPRNPPDPAFPDGRDIDISEGASVTCLVELPYPTPPRIGFYLITCKTCGYTGAITTAGRPDDPRLIKIACMPTLQ